MFSIKPKTLHYWYKHELSGYDQEVAAGTWGEKKIAVKVAADTGEVLEEKPVHIAKEENMGTHMTIDEKQIGKKMYTIMTNAQTDKIALLTPTLKVDELSKAIEFVSAKVSNVKSVSCDMSPSYQKFCRETFPTANIVIDKFHVVKHVMDALQQVRRKIKDTIITKIKPEAKKEEPGKEETEWTEAEQTERSRYVLCKMEAEWENDEKRMMSHLFSTYPKLQKAYELTQKIRIWYHKKNIKKHENLLEIELYQWCDDVVASKISEFRAVRKMIEKHQDNIMNYFKEGQTNAKAENMNGKIQRFLANNFGIKDRDFFLYRLSKYFS